MMVFLVEICVILWLAKYMPLTIMDWYTAEFFGILTAENREPPLLFLHVLLTHRADFATRSRLCFWLIE